LAIADGSVGLPDQIFDDARGVDLAGTRKRKEPPQLGRRELSEVLGIVGNDLGRARYAVYDKAGSASPRSRQAVAPGLFHAGGLGALA
jgi:hypothetical protein